MPNAPQSLCQEGHLPYPDANVFAVLGVSPTDQSPSLPHLTAMVVVSTRAELAGVKFQAANRGAKALLTLTLAEVKAQVMSLRAFPMAGRRVVVEQASPFDVQPFVVTHWDTDGRRHRTTVVASSVEHAKNVAHAPEGALAVPLDLLDDLLITLSQAQSGEVPAPYAWDLSLGGEWDQHRARRRASQSAEQAEDRRASAQARWARMPVEQQAAWGQA